MVNKGTTSVNATGNGGVQQPRRVFELLEQGQSIWLDYLTRDLIRSGQLKQMIEQDGIRGMTSNPTIFHKAMTSGHAYDSQLAELINTGKDASEILELVMVRDIQDACDVFLPLYNRVDGTDGFVSIEVSPAAAHDTEKTVEEARRLWKEIARPNLMIKVPGTVEGAAAVTELTREGVNVNITLLFSVVNHERVMWAYIDGLEQRVQNGLPVNRVASVASYFVSRVDTLVDKLLEKRMATGSADEQKRIRLLIGKTGIANAKLAYARFLEIFGGARFAKLREQGARVQRPLWASTSTKNPAYRDVIYVEELIGPDTVNTIPEQTLVAFEDHGMVRRTIDQNLDEARGIIDSLKDFGVDYDAVTRQLEDEGIDKFEESFLAIIEQIEKSRLKVPHTHH